MSTVRTAAAPFGALTIWRLVATLEALPGDLRMAARAARTRRELSRLTAHERADIGLDDIDAAAEALARR